MNDKPFTSSECRICRTVVTGRFSSRFHFCSLHLQDEIDFHQSLQDGELTRDQKAQRILYARRWKSLIGPVQPKHISQF